jgi:hypothetical protein
MITNSGITTLLGVKDRIKQLRGGSTLPQSIVADNDLHKLKIGYSKCYDGGNVIEDPNEKTVLLNLLDTFNGTSNLGMQLQDDHDTQRYNPDIEYILGIKHAGRKFIEGGGRGEGIIPSNSSSNKISSSSSSNKISSSSRSNKSIINHAL